MKSISVMRFGGYEFGIEHASFRHTTSTDSGPGWDFTFVGRCIGNDPADLFAFGAKLLTEAAALPLEKLADYSGVELFLPESFDAATGEPLFGLNVMEEHDVFDVRLKFLERDAGRYLIEITATVAKTVLGHLARLELLAWAEELPDHAYPI